MSPRRTLALARYALAGNLRTPYTWAGAGLMVALSILGLVSSARRGDGWVLDPSFVFDGALLAAIFGIRSGLIAQRIGGLQTFLRQNLMPPVEHMAGAALSLLGAWLLVCAAVLVTVLLLPGGSPTEAVWNATVFALRTGVLIPFVLMAESVSDIRLPFVLPGLAYVVLIMTLVMTLGEPRAVTILAPPIENGNIASLGAPALRLVVILPAGLGMVLGLTGWRNRVRGGT